MSFAPSHPEGEDGPPGVASTLPHISALPHIGMSGGGPETNLPVEAPPANPEQLALPPSTQAGGVLTVSGGSSMFDSVHALVDDTLVSGEWRWGVRVVSGE